MAQTGTEDGRGIAMGSGGDKEDDAGELRVMNEIRDGDEIHDGNKSRRDIGPEASEEGGELEFKSAPLTQLLQEWGQGDSKAEALLMPQVYNELRRIAGAHLRGERPNHTLQPTALAHEAFLRLKAQNRITWRDRAHFFAIASTSMRRILVDHARSLLYAKRGGGQIRVELSHVADQQMEQPHRLIELDDLLNRLSAVDASKAALVEMRLFGGMTEKEIAEVQGCSERTVTRHWRRARAWLVRALNESTPGNQSS